MSELEHILRSVETLFLKYGVKSVTMDDVSRHLSISKKTLYLHVENKADLVEKVLMNHIEEDKDEVGRIMTHKQNAIDSWIEISLWTCNKHADINPSLMYDLQKYYPKMWLAFKHFTDDFIAGIVKNNLIQGQKEKLYRKDINPELLSIFYTNQIKMYPETVSLLSEKLSFSELYTQMIHFFIHGVVTEKGLKHLNSKINSK